MRMKPAGALTIIRWPLARAIVVFGVRTVNPHGSVRTRSFSPTREAPHRVPHSESLIISVELKQTEAFLCKR